MRPFPLFAKIAPAARRPPDFARMIFSVVAYSSTSLLSKNARPNAPGLPGADDAAELAHQRFAHVQIFTEVVLDGLHFPQAGRITGNSGKVRVDAAQLFDLL